MSDLNIIKPEGVQNLIDKFCVSIGMIPTAYKNALTYEGQILAIGNYLEKVVYPAINNNAEALAELQTLFVELKDYVDNYFDNLDIQTEVDNKLDEMAEGGELAPLIAEYLELQAVLGFANIEAMSEADYITNGAFMRTYGTTSLNDGDGGFYYARGILNTDVIDGYYIVALNDPNLVAVRCGDSTISQIETEIAELQGDFENLIARKFLFVGDSYLQGYTPNGTVSNFADIFASLYGLTSSDYRILANGGAGFANGDNTFYNIINNDTGTDKNKITDVIICGGYNDRNNIQYIDDGVDACVTLIKTNYPNIKNIHIGMVGGSNIASDTYKLYRTLRTYIVSCTKRNCHYINNIENSLCLGANLASDGYHPSEAGQTQIARNLVQYFNTGNIESIQDYSVNLLKDYQNNNVANIGFVSNNGFIQILYNNVLNANISPTTITCNGQSANRIEIGTFTDYIGGSEYENNRVTVQCIVRDTGGVYHSMNGSMCIANNKMYVDLFDINDAGNNYRSITINQVQFAPFTGLFIQKFFQ